MDNATITSAGVGRVGRRNHIYWTSRCIVCLVVAVSFGTLFLSPANSFLAVFDVLLRAYLMFIGSVMAHEASHGHLGRTRAANFWWGRVALLPAAVPFTNFRKTHALHHLYTNVEGMDPDHFMKPRRAWEIPFRALAMPHQWFLWLRRRGRMGRRDRNELLLNYCGIAIVYLVLLPFIGAERLFGGVFPALILVSLLLWYPFALKTHEGFSTGAVEARSHDYYGKWMYWLSLGLSMHRVHHSRPELSWLELRAHVREAPGGGLLPRRHIVLEQSPVASRQSSVEGGQP